MINSFNQSKQTAIFYRASGVFELTKWLILIVIVLALFHFFIATIMRVEGVSMEPTLGDRQFLLVNKISYLVSQPKRGDIVALKFPGDPERKRYIKRVIGLPGEELEIKEGMVWINKTKLSELYLPAELSTEPETKLVLGWDEYYLMGDNRSNSNDSRIWGQAPNKFIFGGAIAILLPLSEAKVLVPPDYE